MSKHRNLEISPPENKKNMTHRLIIPLLLLLTIACSKNNDEPLPTSDEKSSQYEVMVVFAPGQLGDNGYADNVLQGINSVSQKDTEEEADSMNVSFIATYDQDDLATAVKDWASNAANPFHSGDYERRLLVLTEPYLSPLLADIGPLLRPSDEVLLLKVNEDDVESLAQRYGLNDRIHGLNISAATSARNYCRNMRQLVEGPSLSIFDEIISLDTLYFFRLYDNQTVTYRDSIYETLQEEFGQTSTIVTTSINNLAGEGIFSVEHGNSVIESAFNIANEMLRRHEDWNASFAFVDLGNGNAGWDYFLLGTSILHCFRTLMLDVPDDMGLGRAEIQRHFGDALLQWSSDWASSPTGTMPRQVTHCNGQYCEDDYSFIFE